MSALKQPKIGPGIILPGTTIGGEVGTFNADFVLWNRDKTESRALNGLVDTGSAYTLIPATILEELGVERLRSRTFNWATVPSGSFSSGGSIWNWKVKRILSQWSLEPTLIAYCSVR